MKEQISRSTEPEKIRLREQIGVPSVGQTITYAQLEKAIGLPRTEGRYKTVFGAWRKELERDNKIILVALRGQGYMVPNPTGRVHVAGATHAQGLRKIVRSGIIARDTQDSELSQKDKVLRDHYIKASAAIELAYATASKELQLPSLERKLVTEQG